MNRTLPIPVALTVAAGIAALLGPVRRSGAAGQSGGPYAVAADAVTFSQSPGAVGSASYQMVPVVGQLGAVGEQGGGGYGISTGLLASRPMLDTDGDGIPDESDTDADNDGIANVVDARPYDTDNDGLNNFEDPDDDNDGLTDAEEADLGTNSLAADTDGDSFDDRIEVRVLHTDPCSSGSGLRCARVRTSAGAILLTWDASTSVSNYFVERRSSLAGTSTWATVAGPLAATGTPMSVTDTAPAGAAFYRVVVPSAP